MLYEVITAKARLALHEYLVERAALLGRMRNKSESARILFLSARGNPLSVRGIQYILSRYVEMDPSLSAVTPHALRHSFATVITSYSIHYTKLYEVLKLRPSALTGKTIAPGIHEKGIRFSSSENNRPRVVQVSMKPLGSVRPERHHAFLIALPLDE